MAIHTKVTWAAELSPENKEIVMNEILLLRNNGVVVTPPQVTGLTYTRVWATEEIANTWIAMVNTIVPPPISAVVEIT